MKLSKHIC